MILVDAEIHSSHAVVIPNVIAVVAGAAASVGARTADDWITGAPDFCCAWVEDHAIHGDAKDVAVDSARLVARLWLERHFEVILLRADRVWIAAIGELAGL